MLKKSKRGFTLLEVLLTIAIIVLLVPLIISSTGGLLRSQRISKHYNQAVLLAQDALEISYNRLQTDFLGFHDLGDGIHPAGSGSIWGDVPSLFTRTVEITTLSRNLEKDLVEGGVEKVDAAKRIKTIVSWTENGRDEEIELEADFVNWNEIEPIP